MKLVKSIVRPNKVDEVKDALEKIGVSGMTVTEVRGHGRQKGHTAIYRGKEYSASLLPKMEIEVVVPDKIVDEVIQADARNAVQVMEKVWAATKGRMGDVVINVANIPETEMSCILSCRPKGIIYFFSMATSFTRAALGAEGVGADVDLRIGNGYTEGHAGLALNLIRENEELRRIFTEQYV